MTGTVARKYDGSDLDIRKTMNHGLLLLTLLHFVVDSIASQLSPLWPELVRHYGLGNGGTFWLLLIWMLANSFSQFAFGLIGDSPLARQLVWLGPAAAAICLGSVGLSTSPLLLIFLLICGGLGIAAFHPEGAALAGNSWPASRSRAMSIFAMGGFLGQALGPYLSGRCVDRSGLSGLSSGIVVGLGALALLRFFYRESHPPLASNGFHAARDAVRVIIRHRFTVAMLLAIGSLRLVAASGVPVAISYWLTTKNLPKAEIGLVQSCFLGGIGLGGLLCATFVRSGLEWRILWLCPLLSAPLILVIPLLDGVPLKSVTFTAALFQGIALPVFISYGQQLLPESQRVASSITMGVSWGIGGAIVAGLIEITVQHAAFVACFQVFAITTVTSCLLCAGLRRPRP